MYFWWCDQKLLSLTELFPYAEKIIRKSCSIDCAWQLGEPGDICWPWRIARSDKAEFRLLTTSPLPPSSPHCCPLNSLLACPCPRSSPPPLPSNPSQLTFSPSLTVTENGAAYILDYRWAPDASVKVWIMVDGVLVTFADKEVFFFFQQNIFYCTLTKVCCDWCTIICSQKWLDIDQMHFSPFSFSPFFKLCCFDNRKKKKIPVVRENIAFLEQNIFSSFLQQIWKASLKCFFLFIDKSSQTLRKMFESVKTATLSTL